MRLILFVFTITTLLVSCWPGPETADNSVAADVGVGVAEQAELQELTYLMLADGWYEPNLLLRQLDPHRHEVLTPLELLQLDAVCYFSH